MGHACTFLLLLCFRRKRQRSLDLLHDFCRGQQGHLALASALGGVNSVPSLGGVDFVLNVGTKVGEYSVIMILSRNRVQPDSTQGENCSLQ